MTRYQVYLETSSQAIEEGGYLAHIPELMGCVGRGKTKEQAIENARAAAQALLGSEEPVEFDVKETDALTLPPDYVPLRDEELEGLWARAAASRQTLLDTLAAMPSSALDWRANAERWAIVNVLEHLARADLWYASRLTDGGLAELLWRISATRAIVLRRLRDIPLDARGRVTRHNGEDWTPRKVARRMLEHEQEHLDQIRQILKDYSSDS